MNEDIARALLALEANAVQQGQRIADLEFQLRQAHRDLAKVQELLSGVVDNVETLAEREYARTSVRNRMLEKQGSVTWSGRTKL